MSAIKEYYHDEIEAGMKPEYLSNKGNIDDIRCSLNITAMTQYSIKKLTRKIEYEKQHKNRTTVISFFESRIKRLQKIAK
jgi:hypothetical protein